VKRETAATDHVLALTLKAGAYTAFVMILAGLVLQYWTAIGSKITYAGLIVLLATPVLRILVAAVQFMRERDLKYVLISVGVLGIMILAYVLGIQA
jgi:uncharacterized membrane protein